MYSLRETVFPQSPVSASMSAGALHPPPSHSFDPPVDRPFSKAAVDVTVQRRIRRLPPSPLPNILRVPYSRVTRCPQNGERTPRLSNATFYRCLGQRRATVLQFRKYNRLAVHVSVSRCGERSERAEAAQTGIVLSWRMLHHFSKKRNAWQSQKGHLFLPTNTRLEKKKQNRKFIQPHFFIRSHLIFLYSLPAPLLNVCRHEHEDSGDFYWFVGACSERVWISEGKTSLYPQVVFWNRLCWKEITFIFGKIKCLDSVLGSMHVSACVWSLTRTQTHAYIKGCANVHLNKKSASNNMWPHKLLIFNR